MEILSTPGSLSPIWTARETREVLELTPQLVGLKIKELGWYEINGTFALVSAPMPGETGETLLVNLWSSDPRESLALVLSLSNESLPLAKEVVENWPRIVTLSLSLIERNRGRSIEPLPTEPPLSTRVCGNPTSGGHWHVGGFELAFAQVDPEELKRAQEAGETSNGEFETIILESNAIGLAVH